MSALITIILIVWGGYYLAKWFFSYGMPRLLMWLMHRQARKQYEQMFGQQPQQDSQQQRSGQRRSPFSRQQRQKSPRRRHGKIITKDMGEYVEFEEISTYNSSQDQHEAPRKKYPEEPQISDADWEDL